MRMMPLTPAALARASRWIMVSRSPDQYIWNRTCLLTSQTSSIDLLANELSPIATPRLAAARATATSPWGCTAWTPVGEISTGIEIAWPITVVARLLSLANPAMWGERPS